MSGTLCGKIDALISTGAAADRNQNVFKNIFDFFERMVIVGNAERVALQYGLGGTGTDYHDESNPFGENAFFVYKILASVSSLRSLDYYVMFQWADDQAFGASPGNPGKLRGDIGDGVGYVIAWREDNTSPWNGTTNDDGTDTKGTPVWTNGGSTVHVLNRACSDGPPVGTYTSNKEDMLFLFNFPTHRFSILGDADGIVMFYQLVPTGHLYGISFFGAYEPAINITNSMPMFCCNQSIWTPLSHNVFGSVGDNTDYEGGVYSPFHSNIVGCRIISFYQFLSSGVGNGVYHPNKQISPNEYDEFPIYVTAYENPYIILGKMRYAQMASMYTTSWMDGNDTHTRLFIGPNQTDYRKMSTWWDGGDLTFTEVDRLGRTF